MPLRLGREVSMKVIEKLIVKVFEDRSDMDKDKYACNVMSCFRCPHKLDYPKCRVGLYDDLMKEAKENG